MEVSCRRMSLFLKDTHESHDSIRKPLVENRQPRAHSPLPTATCKQLWSGAHGLRTSSVVCTAYQLCAAILHTASTLHDVAHVRSSSPLAAPPPGAPARHRSQLHGTLCLMSTRGPQRAGPDRGPAGGGARRACRPETCLIADLRFSASPVDKIYSEPQPANRLDVYMVSLKICIEGHVAPRPRACGGQRRGRAPQSRPWTAHTPEGRSNRTRLKSEIVRGVRRA